MGKCIICNCDTDNYRCCVKEVDGEYYNDFQCEKCTIEIVTKRREKYEKEFNKKVLPYLLENNFKVIVESDDETEEFIVNSSDVMYCVDIIRSRMESKGYYENWIDVHQEEYNGIDFEVVDYLCYALPDKDDEEWVSYYLTLEGDNGLRLIKY